MQSLAFFLCLFLLICYNCQQIEPDLWRFVFQNALLYLLSGKGKPVIICAWSIRDWSCLKAVKLIQLSIEGHITNKVESVFFFGVVLVLFNFKSFLSVETIVRLSDKIGVSYCPSFVFVVHLDWEVSQISKFIPNLDIFVAVHEDWENCLSSTSIVYHLVCIVEFRIVLA